MPNFKPKATKKILVNKNSIVTLDNKHDELMTKYTTEETKTIPELKLKYKKLKQNLKKCNNIDEELEIKDELADTIKQLKELKNNKKKYLLNNSKYIFGYFEKKQKVSKGDKKTKILHSFFDKDKKKKEKVKTDDKTDVNKYLSNIDVNFIDINSYSVNHDECTKCGGELIHVEHKGIRICNKCSHIFPFLMEHEKPSYKEPPKEIAFYAYKRINHFREILAQFQAKETTQIPDEVIQNIKQQIKKERITLKQMTNEKAKDILKKLGYNKYYEHIPFIKDKLGIKPPIMSPELEDILCNLFMEIQKPYSKHCPDDRVNFLNYYYVLYKMCELLNEKQFLPYFPMLKDPVKRIEQDDIWKKICGELDWEFIPTI